MPWGKRQKRSQEDWDSVSFDELSVTRKRFRLLKEANYACTQCGFNKRREDGHHVVEIDHIDGNHKNNSRENLRVLCPNCHSLTSNFRNYGRSSKQKSGTRLRPANKGFKEIQDLLRQEKEEYEQHFRQVVTDTFQSGEIDYAKFGWVNKLTTRLGDGIRAQVVGKQIRRLMPDFYVEHCFFRRHHRTLS